MEENTLSPCRMTVKKIGIIKNKKSTFDSLTAILDSGEENPRGETGHVTMKNPEGTNFTRWSRIT